MLITQRRNHMASKEKQIVERDIQAELLSEFDKRLCDKTHVTHIITPKVKRRMIRTARGFDLKEFKLQAKKLHQCILIHPNNPPPKF